MHIYHGGGARREPGCRIDLFYQDRPNKGRCRGQFVAPVARAGTYPIPDVEMRIAPGEGRRLSGVSTVRKLHGRRRADCRDLECHYFERHVRELESVRLLV